MEGFSSAQAPLIQKSWQVMKSVNGTFNALLFYNSLFHLYPDLRDLFPKDLKKLELKFDHTMSHLVDHCDSLGDPDIDEIISDLGSTHKKLNVSDEHYIMISEAITATVKKSLGAKYSEEVGQAWRDLIETIAKKMMAAPVKKVNKFQQFLERLFGK